MTQIPEPVTSNNEKTYEELISLIENSQQQLALIIVACDDLALRQRTIERYEREAKQSQIRAERIVLGMEPSLRAGLAKLGIENQDGVIVTVTGAEWLLRVKTRAEDAQSDLDKFFGYLQWTREGLREFRYPIVLWITYPILQEISRRAPDFWSWRKAVLRFTSEESEAPIVPVMRDLNPPERLFQPEGNDDFIPPPAEIISEIHQLESNNPTSANLATLYAKLAEIYAKRIARGEATDLEFEQQQAIDAFEQAIDRYRELNKQSALANILNNFGNFLFAQSLFSEASDFYHQSVDIHREIGDLNREASSLNNLGNTYRSLGKYQQAIDLIHQSLSIKRELGDRHGEAASLNSLGNIFQVLGQYQRANDFYQQSLVIRCELGDRNGEATSLYGLGNTSQLLGKYQQASEFYQQSLEIWREIGDRNGEASSLQSLGVVYRSLQQYQRAIEFYQQCLEIQHKIGDRHGEATSLYNQAWALSQYKPRCFEALTKLKQACDIYIELKLYEKVDECNKLIDNFDQIMLNNNVKLSIN